MKLTEEQRRALERRQTLIQLIEHWRDFFDEPADPGREIATDDQRQTSNDWTLFSTMARWPSVVEMRRCVEVCASTAPQHYRHLVAAYVRVEWRSVDRPIKKRDAHGRMVDDIERCRERIVPPWVIPRMVERAIDFMLGLWNHAIPLELPPGLTLKLRALADADGWTEAA